MISAKEMLPKYWRYRPGDEPVAFREALLNHADMPRRQRREYQAHRDRRYNPAVGIMAGFTGANTRL